MFFKDKAVAVSSVGQSAAKAVKDWKVGEEVFGDVTSMQDSAGKGKETLYTLRLRNPEDGQLTGEILKVWGSKSIDSKMTEVKVAVGSTISISCAKLKEASNGNVYKDFIITKYEM